MSAETKVPVDPEVEQDLVNILGSLAGFIQNERVRAYNEGLDAERERCANIALAIDSGRGNEKEIARAIRNVDPFTPPNDRQEARDDRLSDS